VFVRQFRLNLYNQLTSGGYLIFFWGGGQSPDRISTSFSPSFFPSIADSPVGLGRARSLAAKHFDTIYTVKQLHELQCTTEISVQPLSAEMILWITGHAYSSMALKVGSLCTFGPPTVRTSGPQHSHRIAATVFNLYGPFTYRTSTYVKVFIALTYVETEPVPFLRQ